MITLSAVIASTSGLQPQDLERWIVETLVRPEREDGEYLFHDVDVARVRLILDLRDHWISTRSRSLWFCPCWIRSTICDAACASWARPSPRSHRARCSMRWRSISPNGETGLPLYRRRRMGRPGYIPSLPVARQGCSFS